MARGRGRVSPLMGFIGSFIGISAVALLSYNLLNEIGSSLIVGSLGASAVLLYGLPNDPFAQPKNVLGGHLVSAFIGVSVYQVLGETWLACSLAVAFSALAMLTTKLIHPPGGATALTAVIGGDSVHKLGYMYVITPVGAGVLILIAIARLVNSLTAAR